MTLQGKGNFIWKILECEGGNVNAIASLSKEAGFTHLLIKIADGVYSYNMPSSGDLVPPLVRALHSKGIQAWGWQYLYGNNPTGEADRAIQRLRQTGVDGFVLDVEVEYKEPGKSKAATLYMDRLRAAYPNLPLGLSSYRFPSYHPQVPWRQFLEGCDYNMPQVYWQMAHNPGAQLRRSVQEFQALVPFRPIIPTGAAYVSGSWSPTPAEVTEFLQTCRELNLSAANFWEWSNTRRFLPEVWNAIRDYDWGAAPQPEDISQKLIKALNTRDPAQVVALYTGNAVHVNAARTVQGLAAIRTWYQYLFTQLLPQGAFTLTGFSGVGSSRHFTWTAVANTGQVQNGNDTLGILDGKIAYHYTYFTITP